MEIPESAVRGLSVQSGALTNGNMFGCQSQSCLRDNEIKEPQFQGDAKSPTKTACKIDWFPPNGWDATTDWPGSSAQ
jgi:hypothetical protein